MKDDKLSIQSMDFAVSIVELVKSLKKKRESIHLAHQQNESTPSGVLSFCCDSVRSSTAFPPAFATQKCRPQAF